MYLLLSSIAEGNPKKLVNMALVSEGVPHKQGQRSFTTLVVPSAVDPAERYVNVTESPGHIAEMIDAKLKGR